MTALLPKKYFHVHTNQLANGIVLCWFLGLAFGSVLAFSCRSEFSSLMCSAVLQPVSIVGLLVCTALPFAFFAFAFCNRKQGMICSVCFYKSFSHFFCAVSLFLQFQSAGWLIYILIMFTDACVLMTMLALSLGYARCGLKSAGRWLYYSALGLFAVSGITYCLISPVIMSIFSC